MTSLPVDAAKYDVNKCMWVVRCFNGTRYKHGKEVRGNVPAIHPGVILHFRLNLTTHTLTMAVGDAPAVTLFTDVTGTVHPVVSFYHDNARISVHEPVKCVSADLTAPPRRVVGQFGKYSLLDVISEKPRKRRVEDPLAAAAVPAVVRPKPVVAAPRPPPVPTRWNCGVCTFSNGPSASTCEMCSTAKPAEGAAAASARKWSCGACTFENEPAEAKCTLCGTDRPASTIGIDEPVDAAADESLQIAAAIAAATEAAAAAEAERAKLDAAFTLFKSRPVSAMVADVLGLLAAVAQIQERRFDAAQSRRGDSCRLLAIPLAVHVTPAAFAALAQLVAATAALPVRTDGPSLGADMDVAETALRIAGSHCRRLQATGISLTLLGLSLAPDSGVSALKTALFDMAQSSLPLTDAKRLAVAVQACAVIDDGVALLLPREEERVALVTALLAENAATPFSPQAPKYALLSMLMKKCSREPLLASLIPAWDPLPSLEVLGNGTRCLKLLTDSMLRDDLVSLTAARSGEPAGGGPRLTAHVSSVVVVHARHVFVGVANAIESFSRKSVAERATAPLQSHPALVSLTALWTAVLSNALQVLDAARDILLRDATRASSVEAVLLSSQIAGLLPFVGTVLCLFDKQLAVVEIVLPGLIALIRAVDGVNRLLPAVVLAEKASRFEEMEQHSLEAGSLSRGELDHATAIRDSGLTSAKLHALLDLERTLVSAAARMSAAMVAGTPEEEEEEFLSPWLKSCVLKAGVDVVDALLQGGGAVDDVELLSARAAAGSTFAPGAWPLRPVMSDAVQKLSGNAHGDATAPLDWEVAMTAVYDPAAASRAQRLSQACLADWRRSKACEPYHRARSAFFEQLLSSTPVRDSGETCGALLTQWLHAKAKISPIQRKHGKTAFLDCEIVVLAVYLRHTGLWRDADVVLQALIRGEEVAVIPETLNQIWKRVFNVRRWLTMQKSMFEQGNWVPVGVFASDTDAEAVVEPVPAAPPAPIGGAGGVEESKSGDVPAASRARPTIRRRKKLSPEPCESFEAFKATVISRALFLLSTACALGDPDEEWGALADVDTSGGHTGQLQGKWSGLLAAPTLGPLLTRWKSSLDLDAVDPSDLDLGLDVPAAGSDAPSAPAAAMPPPPDSSEHVTGLEKIKVACGPAQQFLYTGQAAHPDVLRALFARRRVRACQRLYGLKAQNALLGAVSLSSATLDALMFLKPAFRGRIRFVEDLISEGRDVSAVVPDVASIRHHYLKALEGAPSPLQDLVQAAFIALFTRLSEVLASAASEGDLALGRAAMWNWALDFEVLCCSVLLCMLLYVQLFIVVFCRIVTTSSCYVLACCLHCTAWPPLSATQSTSPVCASCHPPNGSFGPLSLLSQVCVLVL